MTLADTTKVGTGKKYIKNFAMHFGNSDLPFLILIERVNTKIYQKDKVMEDPAE